ncbi:MAG: xylose isomerase, partial [Alphaproteobacteria bacterium]|nr:xylose isomerase [Alphaproteobacteria bacterium]
HIGLAHMSGIVRQDSPAAALTEPDRVLIGATDRVENIRQLRVLKAAGFDGFISMEPFNTAVQADPNRAAALTQSLSFVRSNLENSPL